LRVTMLEAQSGIFHACIAQAFLGLIVLIALVTSNFWRSLSRIVVDPKKFTGIKTLAMATTIAIYAQLALGATMRHQHRDLSILDFPTANGAWIPDTSASALAKINAWRDAHHHRGDCILCARLAGCAQRCRIEAIGESLGRFCLSAGDTWSVDDLEQQGRRHRHSPCRGRRNHAIFRSEYLGDLLADPARATP
jgi:hypothetical protein